MSDSSKQIDPSLSNRQLLSKWLNKTLKVQITDGRTLIGIFLCTDKNSNIVLGSCKEYTSLEQSGLLYPIFFFLLNSSYIY